MSVNIRMTAIRLEEGGLWIHAPVAPTEECVRLLTELGEEVRYIVLPTTAVRASKYVLMSIVCAGVSYRPWSRSFADPFRRVEHSCRLGGAEGKVLLKHGRCPGYDATSTHSIVCAYTGLRGGVSDRLAADWWLALAILVMRESNKVGSFLAHKGATPRRGS